MKKTILYIAIVSLIIFLNGYYFIPALFLSSGILLPVIFFGIIFFFISRQNTLFKKILVFSAAVSLILLSFQYQILYVVYLVSIPFIIIYFALIKEDESFKRFLKILFILILTLTILVSILLRFAPPFPF